MRSTTPSAARHVERVLHVTGGMARRHVEGLEVVVVVLHLAALVDLVAHGHEDVLQLLAHGGEGMAVPEGRSRRPGSVMSSRSRSQAAAALLGARCHLGRGRRAASPSSAFSAFSSWPGLAAGGLPHLPQALEQPRDGALPFGPGSGRAAPAASAGSRTSAAPARELLAQGLDPRLEIVEGAGHGQHRAAGTATRPPPPARTMG